jgi:hypothetical protein
MNTQNIQRDDALSIRIPKELSNAINQLARQATPPVSRSAMAAWLLQEGVKATIRKTAANSS